MKKNLLMVMLTLCLCACFVLAFGAAAQAAGSELQLYSDEKMTALYPKVDGVYQIPVQGDIFIPIDATGKTSAVLKMGDQDSNEKSLDEFGDWNKKEITANVWYDNSCAKNGVSSYTMSLVLNGQTEATAKVCATTNGTLTVGDWLQPLYYETSAEGNVLLTTEYADNRTAVTTQNGFTIASGKRLFIWDIPSLQEDCHWIWAGLVGADENGDPIWDSIFSALDLEDGRVELTTAGIAPGTRCILRLSTGGVGYDQVFIDFPVTIEAPRMTISEDQESDVIRNADGSVTAPLNRWTSFGVFMRWADSVTVYCAETEDAAPENAEVYNVIGLDNGYGGFNYTPTDLDVKFPANAQSATRYLFFTAQYDGQVIRSQDQTVRISRTDTIAGTFSFAKTAATVARDGIFSRQISFTPSDGKKIDYLGMCIQDESGKWIADSHWIPAENNQATVTMPPLECAPGTYQVHVYAIRFGASRLDAADTIPLTVAAPASDDPILISMKNPSVTMEALPIYVHYTNPDNLSLDRIVVRIYNSDGEILLEDFTTDPTYWNDWMTFDWTGSYSLVAEVYAQGGETPAATRTFPFEVEAAGQVKVIDPDPVFPSYLTEGADLHFTVSKPTNAEKYNIDVWFDTEEEPAILLADYELTAAEKSETVAAKDMPLAGTVLHISVYGCGYNVNADARQWDIMMVPAAKATDTALTLTVNGSMENQTILSSENVPAHVAYPGNSPTAVRLWIGDHMEYRWGEDAEFDWDLMFERGQAVLYAQATWDEIDFERLDETGWANFDWDTSVSWTGVSNVIVLQISNEFGQMCMPNWTVENTELKTGGSGVLPWGTDLIVKFTDDAPMGISPNGGNPVRVSSGWFNLDLKVERANEDGSRWEDTGVHYPIHSGENHIPSYNLEVGRYQVIIGADAPGYQGVGEPAFTFTVGPRADESQTAIKSFKVNGTAESITVPTATELSLAAYQSGAEWYDVYITRANDPGWEDHRSQMANGMLLDSWRSDSEGEFTLTAYAYGRLYDAQGNPTKDEAGNDFWEEKIGSVTITVTATKGEDLGNPVVSLPDKVTRGDLLTIHFDAVANAEEYSYWIHSAEDMEWLAGGSRKGSGDLKLYTSRLESGVYWVELDTIAAGYNQGHSTLHFALVDGNDVDCSVENTYYFTISTTEQLETEQPARIVAYVPGAEAIRVYSRYNNDPMEECGSCDGPGTGFWFASGRPGTYQFYLSWSSGGNWTVPALVSGAVLTFSSEGDLPAPQVSINGDGSNDTIVPAREDGMVLLTLTKGDADGYYLMLRPTNSGEEYVGWNIEPEDFKDDPEDIDVSENTITFKIGPLDSGRAYDVVCDAHKQGWTQSTFSRCFVLQEAPTGSGRVTLSVAAANEDGFWTGEEVLVSTHAEGATAIHIRMGNNEDRWYPGDKVDAEPWTVWDEQNIFYAYATTDPIPEGDFNWHELDVTWSMQSAPIVVNAHTDGPTQVPSVEVPASVAKGDWLTFTINEDGDARQMDVRIFDDQRNEYEFRRLYRTGEWQLPTSNLKVGKTYRLQLACVQGKHLWANSPEYCFTVTAPQTEKPVFRMNKSTVYQNEPFIPTVYAPEAVKVKVMLGGGTWGEWEGDNGTNHADWNWFLEDAGTHTFYAYALYKNSQDWTEIGTWEMTVKEPTPLSQAVIEVTNPIDVTQDSTIQIPLVEGGEHYILEIHYQGQEKDWIRMEKDSNKAQNGKLSFTVGANTLMANQAYWIDCYVEPANDDYAHGTSDSSRSVMTVSGNSRETNIQVQVNKTSAPVNTNVTITVSKTSASAQTPTAVAVYMGDQVQYLFFEGTSMQVEMGDYQPWPETVFARAYYGTEIIGKEWEEVDWNHLSWGSATAPVQVTFTSNGQAGPADIDYDVVIQDGSSETLEVQVTLGENANEAHANLNRNLDNGDEDLVFSDWISMDPDNNTIRIPLTGVGAGIYKLYVDNSGEGYENNRTEGFLVIVPDPDKVGPWLTLPAALTEIEEEAFAGTDARYVVIPASVRTIGSRAFADSSVELVILQGSVNSIAGDAFDGTNLWVVYGGSAAQELAERYGVTYWQK